MSVFKRSLAFCAIAGAMAALAAPASAATIIVQSGALPVGASPGLTTQFTLPGGAAYNPANTYYFGFSLNQAADWQSQISINYTLKTSKKAPAPQPPAGSQSANLSYALYQGACTALLCSPVGTALDSTGAGEQTLAAQLSAGSYFLKLTSVSLPTLQSGWSYRLGPSLIGSYTAAAVPEPGAWALLTLGLGAVGAALRGRRRPSPVLA